MSKLRRGRAGFLVLALFAAAASGAEAPPPQSPPEMTATELADFVRPSVVHVMVTGTAVHRDPATGQTAEGSGREEGTGFVIDTVPSGRDSLQVYVVTNEHVAHPDIPWKTKPVLRVKRYLGSYVTVELAGYDVPADLAVLKATVPTAARSSWKPLQWAPCHLIRVGQDVVAIGHPLGHRGAPSLTKGIVSGVDRPLVGSGEFAGLIQTDAAVNPGNSGGPLLDMRGEVVGVNTYTAGRRMLDPSRQKVVLEIPFPGINYARSSETAQPLVRTLIRDGKIARPAVGLTVRTLDNQEALDIGGVWDSVRVATVDPGGPAAAAGLRAGDLICQVFNPAIDPGPLSFGARLIQSEGDWNDALALFSRTDSLLLSVLRKADGFSKLERVRIQLKR